MDVTFQLPDSTSASSNLLWWETFLDNIDPELAQSFVDAGNGIANAATQWGEHVLDGVNFITVGNLYNGNFSNIGNASMSDTFSQTNYYENTLPNLLTAGIYGEAPSIYQYYTGQITSTQFTQQMAASGFFQTLAGAAGEAAGGTAAEDAPSPPETLGRAGVDIGETAAENGLPADPDDLLDQGYNETSNPDAAAAGQRTFENPETGDSLRFDEGTEGEPGNAGEDHYHRYNPNSTGNGDQYLDKNGNPVPRGSQGTHLFPGD